MGRRGKRRKRKGLEGQRPGRRALERRHQALWKLWGPVLAVLAFVGLAALEAASMVAFGPHDRADHWRYTRREPDGLVFDVAVTSIGHALIGVLWACGLSQWPAVAVLLGIVAVCFGGIVTIVIMMLRRDPHRPRKAAEANATGDGGA